MLVLTVSAPTLLRLGHRYREIHLASSTSRKNIADLTSRGQTARAARRTAARSRLGSVDVDHILLGLKDHFSILDPSAVIRAKTLYIQIVRSLQSSWI